MVNGLLRHGDPGHIPKYGGQPAYPVRVQRGHVQAVHISPGCLNGKYRQHVRPVRGLPVQGDRVIVPGLQQLQAAVVGHVDRSHRLGHGNGARCVRLLGEEQAEGGVGDGGDHHNYHQGQQQDTASDDTGQGADKGRRRLCHGNCRFFQDHG